MGAFDQFNPQDQEALVAYLDQYAKLFNGMVKELLSQKLGGHADPITGMLDDIQLQKLMSSGVEVDSAKLVSQQMTFMQKQMQLWQSASKAMMGEAVEPVAPVPKGDGRFRNDAWQANPVFNYLKQAYLLNAELLQGTLDSLSFKDPKAEEQMKFYTRQYISSLSPTNYVWTNPEVCEEILNSKGECLLNGFRNFVRDAEKSPLDAFTMTQTDTQAFSLGENLATTPGEVVYQNDLIQLIHYTPTTEKVHRVPLLFIPPFINKYYILDLDEKKSLVRYMVSQGFSVFMISWRNPDQELSHKNFSDYMQDGPLAAIKAIKKICPSRKVNLTGFCVGGTLLATTAAYLKAKGEDVVNSLTFLTTLLDFSEPGEVGNFLTEQMLPLVEKNARMKGVLDGRILGMGFSMLRENNLFWSFFITNYLKGKDPAPFDILYWNSDASNLTEACFSEYVHSTYRDNRLMQPGEVVLDAVPIDLGCIDAPSFFLATKADHIVLWQSAYQSAQLLGGDKRFVLAGSGHLAGVINPVDGGKYPHWLNDELPTDAKDWLDKAEQHDGSWWPNWAEWLKEKSGQLITAPQPGDHQDYPALEPAPGSYVKRRLS